VWWYHKSLGSYLKNSIYVLDLECREPKKIWGIIVEYDRQLINSLTTQKKLATFIERLIKLKAFH